MIFKGWESNTLEYRGQCGGIGKSAPNVDSNTPKLKGTQRGRQHSCMICVYYPKRSQPETTIWLLTHSFKSHLRRGISSEHFVHGPSRDIFGSWWHCHCHMYTHNICNITYVCLVTLYDVVVVLVSNVFLKAHNFENDSRRLLWKLSFYWKLWNEDLWLHQIMFCWKHLHWWKVKILLYNLQLTANN